MSNASQLRRDYWDKEYESSTTPFDIDEPDDWIVALEKSGKIHGNVLDSGCGPGRTSFYLADRGYSVLGVDISVNAIERAKRKAAEKGNNAQFLQANMCELSGYDKHFDTVVDIGCFHSLDENDRATYAAVLHRICRAGAVIYLRAFSETNLKTGRFDEIEFKKAHTEFKKAHPYAKDLRPPALREEQIRTAFSSNGWVIKDLLEREIELFISENEKPRKWCWFAEMQYAE